MRNHRPEKPLAITTQWGRAARPFSLPAHRIEPNARKAEKKSQGHGAHPYGEHPFLAFFQSLGEDQKPFKRLAEENSPEAAEDANQAYQNQHMIRS